MKIAITTLFISLCAQYTFAQKDYIITRNNDTITGTITKAFPLFSNQIKIKNQEGIKTFTYENTKEYKRRNLHMIPFMRTKKGKVFHYHCTVAVDGKMRLLKETLIEAPSYFIYYNEEFFIFDGKFFPPKVWETLMQNPHFVEKYGTYQEANINKKWMVFPREAKAWAEMISHYNNTLE